MHDIAGVAIINATVLATTYWQKRTLDRFRTDVLDGLCSLRSDVICQLNAMQDLRDLRNSYREQHQK